MTLDPSGAGLTTKEVVLRLDAKLEAYITAHQSQHAADMMADAQARSDPAGTAAGRRIVAELAELRSDVISLADTVKSHDRTLQRLIGASILLSAMGLGTVAIVALRIAGLLP